jgi:Cu(I)/Ag(I) efflux system membrane fusion protein
MNPTGRFQRGAKPVAVVAMLAAVGLAAGGGYWFGTRAPTAPAAVPAAIVAPVAAPAADARKVLYWHDPMVPNAKFDHPGKSPFMDMQLVPVYADAAADGGVAISARQQQSFGVRTAEAKRGSLASGFSAVGAVVVDERGVVAVQSRSPGYVEKLLVRAQYDGVAAGQPLVELYVPDWLAAQEELLALKASAQPGAAGLVDAARARLRLLGMPDAEVARVERDGKASARVTVTAPQGGIVWEIGARDGMAVMPGTTLFKLAALGNVWVIAEVPEAQAALVKTGAPVEVRATAFPDRVWKGSVNALLPEVNAATRTLRARIVVANPGGALKPGMFATLAFGGEAAPPGVLVPAEAVIQTGKRAVVIVAAGDGRFVPVDVEVAREAGDLAEIRKGLDAGQRVVVSGQFLVDSEANLRGALARIGAGDAAAAAGVDSQAGKAVPAAAAPKAEAQKAEVQKVEVQKAEVQKVEVHRAEGVVRAVGDEVLIKHGAIPSAGMGAMTMAFKAPPGGLPKNVQEGTAVRFEFVLTPRGDMQLTSIVPGAPAGSGKP